ncbi:MAG: hypothetical protein KAT40_00560 [Bacteroidales bacterium]|nr:hypothetical protein [Bacteroidales bacterium]
MPNSCWLPIFLRTYGLDGRNAISFSTTSRERYLNGVISSIIIIPLPCVANTRSFSRF